MNETLNKFGYPDTLVKEYNYWCICLRPEQVTLGSLVLICKNDVTRYSEISNKAFQEYPRIIKAIENTLFELFEYDKLNYLMLMMVDPNVHFHVIPRYAESKVFNGSVFNDFGWPGIPELSKHNQVSSESLRDLREELKKAFIK